MHLHQIGIQLAGNNGDLRGRDVTPAGLHGVFYDVIRRSDPDAATWLHEHPSPKPYTLAPAHYDKQRRELAGMVISTLTDVSAETILHAFHTAYDNQTQLTIGKQPCHITDLIFLNTTTFAHLSHADPTRRLTLHFLTPTAFKQGHGDLLLPLPYNCFHRPYTVWNTFAPEAYQLPSDWLDWCHNNIFVTRHDIRAIQKNINRHKKFAGFIGRTTFTVRVPRQADTQTTTRNTTIFHALAQFANFCGIGRKTTMGMGCAELI